MQALRLLDSPSKLADVKQVTGPQRTRQCVQIAATSLVAVADTASHHVSGVAVQSSHQIPQVTLQLSQELGYVSLG